MQGKMSYYGNILEEELKNKVAEDWFLGFDATKIIGKIDFSVALKKNKDDETEYLLWAEAKQGTSHDIYESFVQLILTIGKARTFDIHLPPMFLGAFDAEKIAFIPYNTVIEIFYQNDFNWDVTPSNHETKEFCQVLGMVQKTLEANSYLFYYSEHEKELRHFIRQNFRASNTDNIAKIRINKNNFTHIYQKWRQEVMPTITIDWEAAKKEGLIDADFYLADILSEHNVSLKDKLFVLLRTDRYIYNIQRKATGSLAFESVEFSDGQKAHTHFWNRYSRPPKREYWDYIVERRDLLVPQDIRERKGSFFTPKRWVELSQQYIADTLGEDWQDNYYIWDCAAGTGNLLAGLTNKYNIFASTLDQQDVNVMHDLIGENSLNMLKDHVFQFDFLNDPFTKLPASLQKIVNDPKERAKLVIYINPPYAEAGNVRQRIGKGINKSGTAINHNTYTKYKEQIKQAANELFAQFFIRIYHEIPNCILAEFSKLKILQGPNFRDFRNVFQAKLCNLFLVPASTFDNVKGKFPIGFHVWDTAKKEIFKQTTADIYDKDAVFCDKKVICSTDTAKALIGKWLISYSASKQDNNIIGDLNSGRNDFQNQAIVYIATVISAKKTHAAVFHFTKDNLFVGCIYLAVRQCIEATWLNDRDQFYAPNDTWQNDLEFQSDCLAYTLFHGQNRISVAGGVNHWIPFTEKEVNAQERFESHFMSDYIKGKIRPTTPAKDDGLFGDIESEKTSTAPVAIIFSTEAQAVMDAGRELWRYYHKQPNANPNAAFYDIRLYFQGTNDNGKMNPDSTDEQYTALIKQLRDRLRVLAKKIEPKVYEHGFLLA